MSDVDVFVAPVDLPSVIEKWLNMCGSCDAGLPMGCTCPADDHRPVIHALVDELARTRAGRDREFRLGSLAYRLHVAQLERLTAERDRARDLAARLEAELAESDAVLRSLIGVWS